MTGRGGGGGGYRSGGSGHHRHHHHHHHHRTGSYDRYYQSGGLRPRASSSETNLRRLAAVDNLGIRPGSALGLLQGKVE